MSRTRILLTVVAVALAMSVGVAMAQQGGGRRGGGGWGGGGGRWDPEQIRQRRLQNYQETLGASEEDWTALEPLVANVMDLQDASRARRMGFFGGRRGGRRGGAGGAQEAEQSAVQKAASDLQTTLEDENAAAETIKAQLTAYRAAREKARQDLAKAQEELREVLTVRQEAQCVLAGLLE